MDNGNKIIKSGLWYTVANFLSKGMLFLTTPIFTRLLTQKEFGAFSNFSSWLSLLVIVVTLNVEASLISARFDFEDRLESYVFSALSLSTISTLVWATVCNIFMEPISSFLQIEPLYINCIFAYLLFFPALQLFQTHQRFFYRYKNSVFISLLSTVGSSILSVVLVYTMSNKLGGRIFGHVFPTILIGFVLYLYIAKKGKKIDFSLWKYTLKVCLPYIPHLLSMTVLNSTDRIMITQLCSQEDAALYSVAYNVAMIVTLLLTALNGAFSPWLGEKLAKKRFKDIGKVSKIYIAVFVCFAVGLMLLSPEVLYVMGGKPYMAAKPIMIPITLGCMCQFLYTLFVNVEQFYKKTLGMAVASASAAVINYLLNLWLIPKFGYIAAAYTTLVGYLWLLFVHMILVRRMKSNEVYSYKFVLAIVALLGVISVAMGYLYTNTALRYICALVYAVALIATGFKFRSRILGIFKK